LDCLETGLFTAKTRVFSYWKSLDFLGFSRAKRAFSMGYTGFSPEGISRAVLPGGDAKMGMAVEVMRMRRIIHRIDLAQFLLFVNDRQPTEIGDPTIEPYNPDNFRGMIHTISQRPASSPCIQSEPSACCKHYALLGDRKQAGRFLTFETWADPAAIDAHMTTPAIKAAGRCSSRSWRSRSRRSFS
jgi:hypothetical protein